MTPEEPVGERLARLEQLLAGTAEDILGVRQAAEAQVVILDRRLARVELNVRALEDREVRRAAVEEERARVGREQHAAQLLRDEQATEDRRQSADDRREALRSRVSRWQFWVGVAVTCVATIFAALIAAGHIF